MSCCGQKPSKKRHSKIRHLKPKIVVKALTVKKTFLMCRPTHYQVNYSINPWMRLNNQANTSKAIEQWNDLHDRIKEYGGGVRYLPPQPGLPDMVFTANSGIVFKDKKAVIISNFKYAERKGEEEWFVKWFAEDGWFFAYPSAPCEGAGDALMLGGTLICGSGFRSEERAYNEVEEFWGGPIMIVKLVDPYFYHLDTCFCPLDGHDFMIYPEAFDGDSFSVITEIQKANGINAIIIPEDEAKRFACNAVCIDRTVIMPNWLSEDWEAFGRQGLQGRPRRRI